MEDNRKDDEDDQLAESKQVKPFAVCVDKQVEDDKQRNYCNRK